MRRVLCAVILVCSVVPLLTPVVEPAESADVKQAVKERIREYSEALTKHDLAALDKIWADGYTFTNGRGEFLTKKERLENIKTGATQFESIAREGEEMHIFGDTAVVTARIVLKVVY